MNQILIVKLIILWTLFFHIMSLWKNAYLGHCASCDIVRTIESTGIKTGFKAYAENEQQSSTISLSSFVWLIRKLTKIVNIINISIQSV